jgi:hypothetical protein
VPATDVASVETQRKCIRLLKAWAFRASDYNRQRDHIKSVVQEFEIPNVEILNSALDFVVPDNVRPDTELDAEQAAAGFDDSADVDGKGSGAGKGRGRGRGGDRGRGRARGGGGYNDDLLLLDLAAHAEAADAHSSSDSNPLGEMSSTSSSSSGHDGSDDSDASSSSAS